MNNNKEDLERERKKFEEELERQEIELMLGGNNNNTTKSDTNLSTTYQKKYKKTYSTLLISLTICFIIVLGSWLYYSEKFSAESEQNLESNKRIVNIAVKQYYQDIKKYPINNNREVDIDALKNKGYLTIGVEEDDVVYILDNNYRVLLKKEN